MRLHHSPRGEMSTKDILIVATIALGAAIIVLFAFILFSKQARPTTDQSTLDRIQQIQQQAAQQAQDNTTQTTPQDTQTETTAPVQVFTGVIRTYEDPTIVLQSDTTNELVILTLPRAVSFSYNGEAFDTSKLLEGDRIRVQAEDVRGNWQALNVEVLFSSSPETPAALPEIYEERPDGTIKPLG